MEEGDRVKQLAWCTDIHLDFLDGPGGSSGARTGFIEPLSQVECDGLLITGDISLAHMVTRHLQTLSATLKKPIYFVLGNHDFYGGSFEEVRNDVRELCNTSSNLKYLTGLDPIQLGPGVALVGDDGWYDAAYGDPQNSPYVMTDWIRIHDYLQTGAIMAGPFGARPNMGIVIGLSRKFAQLAADRMRRCLSSAAQTNKVVMVATHVPPWPQVHQHNGKTGDEATHPWYTSRIMGEVIEEIATAHPDVRFEVFCGHTHGKFDARLSSNIFCHVGGSQYGSPDVAGMIRIP